MELVQVLVSLLRDVMSLTFFIVGPLCVYQRDFRFASHAGLCLIAMIVSFIWVLLYNIIIYPRFRSPLRHLPIVPVSRKKSLTIEDPDIHRVG